MQDPFERQIEKIKKRCETLSQLAGNFPEGAALAAGLGEISAGLEKLHGAGKELRRQNEELSAAQLRIDAERQRYQELIDFAPDECLTTDVAKEVTQAATMFSMLEESLAGKLAEEAFAESGVSYRAIFDSVNDAIFVHDLETGEVLDVNTKMVELTGYSKTELVKGGIPLVVADYPPYTAKEAMDWLKKAAREGPQVFAWLARKRNGETSWLEISLNRAPIGGKEAILAVVRDISERKWAEEALRESEEKYRTLLDNLDVGVFRNTADPEGITLQANQALARILGVDSLEELFRIPVSSFYKTSEERAFTIAEITNQGIVKNKELRLRRKDGTQRCVSVNAQTKLGPTGEIKWIDGVIEDITHRKQAEERLLASHQQLLDIIEFLPDATFVIDHERKVIAWNRAIEEMTGVPKADILGKGDSAYAVTFYGKPRPTLIDFAFKPDAEQEKMYDFIEKRGKTLHTEVFTPQTYGGKGAYLYATASPLYDPDGNLIGAIESLRDISERKKAEQEHFRLVTAVEQAEEVMIITDQYGRIEYANPGFELTSGYVPTEARGNDLRAIGLTKDGEPISPTLNGGAEGWSGRITCRKKNGVSYELETTISPIRDNSGKIINYVIIGRDVTHEMDLEKQLRQAQKMEAIGTLAGGIAHDFNNILTGIIGYTELMLLQPRKEDLNRRYIEKVLEAGHRAKDLVKQILAFSRQSDEEKKPIRVAPIAEETIKLLRASLPSTIRIKKQIQTQSDLILADPTQIHQVLMNLCTNAAHAMRDKGGMLELSLTDVPLDSASQAAELDLQPGDYLRLTVKDTGHGMTKEVLERIFDPYFTTKPRGEGTGLGLSVVHGIVKSYGGSILVETEPEKGTTISIFFPQIHVAVEHKTNVLENISCGSERVLFVDDEKLLVELAEEILSGLGYAVATRTSSVEALELFRMQPDKFDLVITDMTMPNMTGLDLAEEMLRIRPGLPIIMCTGFSSMITPEKLKAIGIRELLMKPMVTRQIAGAIRRALDQ